MKIFSNIKMLALVAGMMMTSNAMAGDGTKANPYTVAELNAQKEALAASGETVWVQADLKGLGADGTQTENAGTAQCAGLFGDASDTFVAYSYQILGELVITDLTNTSNLLIALTYGTEGHPYGNTTSPQYASNYEPAEEHFSLVEVHKALSLSIPNGHRGYHIGSSYIVPENVIAVKVAAGYSSKQDPPAYVNYTKYDGSEAEYATPKNAALILMAMASETTTYDFVLTTQLYDQTFSNGNSLNPGTQAGVNAGTTKNRARFVFVDDGIKVGFERNSDENCTVTLNSKDEVFLQVNSQETNFWGNWAWEGPEKNWITWEGGEYSEGKNVFDFHDNNMDLPVGTSEDLHAGDLDGVVKTMGEVTISFTAGNAPGSRYFYSDSKSYHFNPSKNSTFTLKAEEGRAIKSVYIGFQNNSKGLNVDKGTYDGAGTWTGSADAVTFTAPGARYIYYINVIVGDREALKGDVNGDGVVNGTDIQAVINRIVASEYDVNADVNEDLLVNGTDIQEIINIIVAAE
jgi:hypothetical protein